MIFFPPPTARQARNISMDSDLRTLVNYSVPIRTRHNNGDIPPRAPRPMLSCQPPDQCTPQALTPQMVSRVPTCRQGAREHWERIAIARVRNLFIGV